MKTTHLIPIAAGLIVMLASCSDSEPAQPSPTTVPAPTSPTKPTTTNDRSRDPMHGATSTTGTNGTSGTVSNDPPVLRGERANAVDSAKTAATRTETAAGNAVDSAVDNTTGAVRNGVGGDSNATTRGDRSNTGASAVNSTNPATAGGTTEANLLPDRDAADNAEAQRTAVDDSGRNKREDGSLPTPLDQSETEVDRKITQGIRSSVVDRDDLSVNAKNVKIITRDGVVTLRGPVANASEKEAIATIAQAQAGVTKVDNHLEPQQ
jgi:hyperosmotically inducible protein